jgi:hypothetical protein
MPTYLGDVRCWVNSGKHLLSLSFSGFDPGCVKTRTSRECVELFSLFFSFDGDCQRCSFLIQRNRDKPSTRKFDIGVFTQPGPLTDLGSSPCYTVVDLAATSHKVDGLCQERLGSAFQGFSPGIRVAVGGDQAGSLSELVRLAIRAGALKD